MVEPENPSPQVPGDSIPTKLQRAQHLIQAGDLPAAAALFAELMDQHPEDASLYGNAAVVSRRLGRLDEAVAFLQRAIRLDPSLPELSFNLGNALAQKGDWDGAINAYKRALELRPDYPGALFNLGNALLSAGQIEAAIGSYAKAIWLKPDFPDPYFNLGNAFRDQGLLEPAIRAYRSGLSLDRGRAEAWFNLGCVYILFADTEAATAALRQALVLRPEFPEARIKLANVLHERGFCSEARSLYKEALALRPGMAESHFNLGILCREVGDLEAAIKEFRIALELDSSSPDIQRNLAMALLLTGDFKEGWLWYESRLRDSTSGRFRPCPSPWQPGHGEERLLVTGEQGLGDQIMFCSLLTELSPHVSRLSVQLDSRLRSLLQRSHPEIHFFDPAVAIPDSSAEACIPIGSLARFFRHGSDDFGRSTFPYLCSDPHRVGSLRDQLSAEGTILIGISWCSISPKGGQDKSIDLQQLAACLSLPGVQLVNLQYGDVRDSLRALAELTGIDVINVDSVDTFHDIDGLAALIQACDLVVTTSNTTVHLAGALGKPTWLLLQKIPDWRWGLHGETCLWYPSVRIFRQACRGQWDGVLRKVGEELAMLLALARPAAGLP
jgi:tetratricopeptide (TPR) repeat protein